MSILFILEISRVFWSFIKILGYFWSFGVYFNYFGGSKGILVLIVVLEYFRIW